MSDAVVTGSPRPCSGLAYSGVRIFEIGHVFDHAQLAGRDTVVPGRFTLADVLLYSFLEFGGMVGQPLNPEFKNVQAWFEKTAARASAQA